MISDMEVLGLLLEGLTVKEQECFTLMVMLRLRSLEVETLKLKR